MKTLSIMLAFIAVLSMGLAYGQPFDINGDWIIQYSGNPNQNIKALSKSYYYSDSKFNLYAVGTGGLVITSTDGGWNWQDVALNVPGMNQPDYDFTGVAFLQSGSNPIDWEGWITGYKNTGADKNAGIVLRKMPGTWAWAQEIVENIPPNTPFLSLTMKDNFVSHLGYIGCGNGLVLKYYSNIFPPVWKPTPKRPTPNSDSISIWYNHIWSDDAGYIIVSGDNSCLISHSADGGNNWTPCDNSVFDRAYTFPEPTNLPQTKLANFNIWCQDNSLYTYPYIFSGFSDGKIASSWDNGLNWCTLKPLPQGQWVYGPYYRGVYYGDPNEGCGTDGSVNFGFKYRSDEVGYHLRGIFDDFDFDLDRGQWIYGDKARILRNWKLTTPAVWNTKPVWNHVFSDAFVYGSLEFHLQVQHEGILKKVSVAV